MTAAAFFRFATERHAIYVRRSRGLPPPWTDDAVLRDYHFCNVYRELDRGTRWLTDEWYGPHAEHENLWFAACVARRLNWPPTMAAVGFPDRWRPQAVLKRLRDLRASDVKVFHNAYRVMTGGGSGAMEEYVVAEALSPLWARRREWHALERGTLASVAAWLQTFRGWGPFLSGQVVLDLATTRYLRDAPDRATWTSVGPGSARGLNRTLGSDVDARVRDLDAVEGMLGLVDLARRGAWPREYPRLRACDVEHALCEFDKYERARGGRGALRRFRQSEGG